jgi:hypothetical protein
MQTELTTEVEVIRGNKKMMMKRKGDLRLLYKPNGSERV